MSARFSQLSAAELRAGIRDARALVAAQQQACERLGHLPVYRGPLLDGWCCARVGCGMFDYDDDGIWRTPAEYVRHLALVESRRSRPASVAELRGEPS